MTDIMQKYRDATDEMVRRIIHDRGVAIDRLTEKQVEEAFVQALKCGDFCRLCSVNEESQAVTYEPYRRVRELEERIKLLSEELLVVKRGEC